MATLDLAALRAKVTAQETVPQTVALMLIEMVEKSEREKTALVVGIEKFLVQYTIDSLKRK